MFLTANLGEILTPTARICVIVGSLYGMWRFLDGHGISQTRLLIETEFTILFQRRPLVSDANVVEAEANLASAARAPS